MRRFVAVGVILLLLASTSIAGLWQGYLQFLQSPLNIETGGLVINVEPGASIRSVVAELERRSVTQAHWHWRLLVRLQPLVIKAGEYLLVPGMSAPDLLQLLASGKVVSYRFTIVEGWSLQQLLAELGKDPVLQHSVQGTADLAKQAGFHEGNLEGWFLPETYMFERGGSDLNILQRAYTAMQQALAETWVGRDDKLPYETQKDLLIMASIIEKETGLDAERAAIAGVFVRRLNKHWRLETDPTVIYGMGVSYAGNISRRDLKHDTPYNTYTRHGLPPTPIALPGEASLQAAARPAAGEAMFFVADGQGGHTFSVTLQAHNEAVRKLLKSSKKPKKQQDSGK